MTPGAQFEQWLLAATYGLASDGVERVRAEIHAHYQAALATGATPEQAIAALGDPKQANREYRKVFLTEFEADNAARTAAQIADPKASAIPAWVSPALLIPFVLLSSIFKSERWNVWIWAPMVALEIVRYFFPASASTPLRARVYFVASLLIFPWMAWQWSTHDGLLMGIAGLMIVACLLGLAFAYTRRIHRKLGGRPAPKLIPPPHGLSRWEHISIMRMRSPAVKVDGFILIALLAAAVWFQPVVGGPALLLAIVRCLLPEYIPIDTLERSHRFRLVRSALFAIAAVVPIVYGLSVHWEPRNDFLPFLKFFLVSAGVYGMLISGAVFEWQRVSIRRKLPLAEWPKELYL